jgi:hypothetical protein
MNQPLLYLLVFGDEVQTYVSVGFSVGITCGSTDDQLLLLVSVMHEIMTVSADRHHVAGGIWSLLAAEDDVMRVEIVTTPAAWVATAMTITPVHRVLQLCILCRGEITPCQTTFS